MAWIYHVDRWVVDGGVYAKQAIEALRGRRREEGRDGGARIVRKVRVVLSIQATYYAHLIPTTMCSRSARNLDRIYLHFTTTASHSPLTISSVEKNMHDM